MAVPKRVAFVQAFGLAKLGPLLDSDWPAWMCG